MLTTAHGRSSGNVHTVSRRGALTFGGAIAAVGTLGGCKIVGADSAIASTGLTKKAAAGRKVSIEIYSIWGGTLGQGFVRLAEEFERVQPDIGVAVTFAPSSAGDNQPKLLTAIASGGPPDVGMCVPEITSQWAALGIMTDLTAQAKATRTTGAGFIGPSWRTMNGSGRVWGLQLEADPNFPLFYNKTLFEAAGLDPEKPPTTIDEVDAASARILKHSGSRVVRTGMVPWNVYGFANSFYTWGFSFGASFVDTVAHKVVTTSSESVAALQWMVDYAKSVGGAGNVSVSPPSLQGNPFSAGNLGMAPMVASDLATLVAGKPKFTFGSTLLPYGPPGGTRAGQGAWLGGWSLFCPRGSKHPDEAWEFIRWACATNAGSTVMYKSTGFPPVWASSPAFAQIDADKTVKPFHDALKAITQTRPAIPVANFLTAQLETEVASAVYGQVSARQALGTVESAANREWDRFRRQVGNGGEPS